MSSPILEKMAQVVVESRNSGLDSIREYVSGWRPKRADQREEAIISLLAKLDDGDRQRLFEVIRYCTDLSFFKLLTSIEEGRNNLTFELVAKDEDGNARETLVSDSEDRNMRQKYWQWSRTFGH